MFKLGTLRCILKHISKETETKMTSTLARFSSIAFAGVLVAGLITIGTSAAAQAQATPDIGVTVDGNQISFPGTQPIELHGSVLVPLRGVFQALGARVDYDP